MPNVYRRVSFTKQSAVVDNNILIYSAAFWRYPKVKCILHEK